MTDVCWRALTDATIVLTNIINGTEVKKKGVHLKFICLTWKYKLNKGMDIQDLVEIVILKYDHWPQFVLRNVRNFGKWPVLGHIVIIIFS